MAHLVSGHNVNVCGVSHTEGASPFSGLTLQGPTPCPSCMKSTGDSLHSCFAPTHYRHSLRFALRGYAFRSSLRIRTSVDRGFPHSWYFPYRGSGWLDPVDLVSYDSRGNAKPFIVVIYFRVVSYLSSSHMENK